MDGEIILAVYRLPTYLEFVFCPDGSVEFRREKNDVIEVEDRDLNDGGRIIMKSRMMITERGK